jgi:hypothetical protein
MTDGEVSNKMILAEMKDIKLLLSEVLDAVKPKKAVAAQPKRHPTVSHTWKPGSKVLFIRGNASCRGTVTGTCGAWLTVTPADGSAAVSVKAMSLMADSAAGTEVAPGPAHGFSIQPMPAALEDMAGVSNV